MKNLILASAIVFCMLSLCILTKAQVPQITTTKVTVAHLPTASRDAQPPVSANVTVVNPAPTLTTISSSALGIIGVVNGKGNVSSGALLRVFTFAKVPKLSAYTFTGVGLGQKNTPVWVAPALGYSFTPTFIFVAGWQGVDLTTGEIAHGIGNLFAGINWTIPIKTAAVITGS